MRRVESSGFGFVSVYYPNRVEVDLQCLKRNCSDVGQFFSCLSCPEMVHLHLVVVDIGNMKG